jgi:predicted AAA+ superfamily ATPase
LAKIDSLTALPRLLVLLASRAAGLLNLADISRTAGIPYTSLQRHVALLEKTFLVQQIDAWATNLGARVLKSAKLLIVDSGLAVALLDLRRSQLANHPMFGHLVENFVLMELRKQCSWHAEQPTLYHFRTPKGAEVDAVLEIQDQVFGIEIKCTGTVTGDDFRGLRILADIAGKRFRRGVVLYLGPRVVPFGTHLHAVPLSALWEW